MRIYLIEMFNNNSKENYFTFIFSSHHVLFDGWSLSLMMKEIYLNYSKFTYCQQKMMNINTSNKELLSNYYIYILLLSDNNNEITESSKLNCFKDYIIWLENNDLHFRAKLFWKRESKGI